MRPVLLELDGFASFRSAATIDFEDADYFVLVGATGSGKSTVIDAITFALYASVARWDKENVVSPALAPTATRGTVKFVFDAKGERYIVIRDVRRNASTNQVTVKTSRIERLLDRRALGGPDDDTEPLGEGKAVKAVVEALLGLDFNQFTKCVALPQGDVAEFLHASAAERQKILTKLLGIEVYTKIQQAANSLAAEQNTRADTLEGSITRTDTDEPDRLLAAQQRVEALATFKASIEPRLQALSSTAAALADAEREQERLREAHTALCAVSVPEDVAELESRRASADAALAEAKAAREAAEQREETARQALESAPSRASLERVAALHQQRLEAADAISDLEQAHADAEQAVTEAKTAHDEAESAAASAVAAAAEAAGHADQAEALAAAAQQQLDALAAAEEPADLEDLHAQRSALDAEQDAAKEELEAAGDALAAAQLKQESTRDQVALERARAALEELLSSSAELVQARLDASEAERAQATDAEELTAAELAQAAAQERLDHARAADTALTLRGHLVAGEPCPVCEQTVATLPAAGSTTDLTALAAVVEDAKENVRAARSRAQASHATATAAAQAVSGGATRLARCHAAATDVLQLLDTNWDLPAAGIFEKKELAALDKRARTIQALVLPEIAAAAAAREACRAGETRRATAERAVQGLQQRAASLEQAASAARASLRQRCDELLPLGRPAVDTDDPIAGWRALTAWTSQELEQRTPALEALTTIAAGKRALSDAAATHLQELQRAEGTATEQHQQAIATEATTRAQLENGRSQLARLTAVVADEDSPEKVGAALDALTLVEEEDRDAAEDRVATRAATDRAQAALADLEGELRTGRASWSAQRDQLLRFGTPPAASESLADSWAALVDWAEAEATVVAAALNEHAQQTSQTRAGYDRDDRQVRVDCAAYGVEGPATPVTTWVLAEIAGAQASAGAAVAAIEEEQRRNADLQRQADEAREQALVASTLGNALRADHLPRWLASNALEVLVEAASETLRDLSGGQFELTTDDSGFQVIDRHDTDSVRGVKTLSGGETFQAALALALALSSQLGTLAASAAAQLEAIFIDEGFGTLDEATLEVVASTLEELAASGGRMVGVITHVPALAERVPVRFKVRRDANGSHVEREQR